ncbi:unnamed protein product [Schistosoma turkestanicum]|nr:unnamed protein product [Schistosoma turkestanicum]
MANGMVERLHRQLKASLTAVINNNDWANKLPLVMLSLRSTVKRDIGCCPAELVYGTTLRLPGELFISDHMSDLRITLPQENQHRVYIPKQLSDTSYVFIRRDFVRRPLQPTYDGPFKVIDRTDKTITVDKAGKTDVVSIDRVKPAFVEGEEQPINANPSKAIESPKCELKPSEAATQKTEGNPPTTRYGRRVRWPQRYIATFLN